MLGLWGRSRSVGERASSGVLVKRTLGADVAPQHPLESRL